MKRILQNFHDRTGSRLGLRTRWLCCVLTALVWVPWGESVLAQEASGSSNPTDRQEADLLDRAMVYWRRGEKSAALEILDVHVASKPRDVRGWTLRAGMLAAEGSHAAAITNYARAIRLDPENGRLYQQRGTEWFRLGRVSEATKDFDKANVLDPEWAPNNWQRGIALYYQKRFAEGREQFELHQTVNPRDVENAVWHFLCVVRESGLEKAREALIPIVGDSRVPMRQIHELFAGKSTVKAVLEAAEKEAPDSASGQQHRFFAHLYLALYLEATDKPEESLGHIREAVRLADSGGYMGDVARVHWQQRNRE